MRKGKTRCVESLKKPGSPINAGGLRNQASPRAHHARLQPCSWGQRKGNCQTRRDNDLTYCIRGKAWKPLPGTTESPRQLQLLSNATEVTVVRFYARPRAARSTLFHFLPRPLLAAFAIANGVRCSLSFKFKTAGFAWTISMAWSTAEERSLLAHL